MIKNYFLEESVISGTQFHGNASNNKKDVLKIQCWLNLFAQQFPGSGTSTGIDGYFGPATKVAVINFQKAKKLPQTGKVTSSVFQELSVKIKNAFTTIPKGNNLRELIVNTAEIHLLNHPFELVVKQQSNSGPWVRAYMDGFEGDPWFWCMGFVQSIIDQAATIVGKDFRSLMPLTYSCDAVGTIGLQKGILLRCNEVRKNPSAVKPGDIFLVQKSHSDWFHTGLVTNINGDVFETIEGNTNNDGSHNGNGVYKRQRNYMKSKLDILSIETLVK